MRRSNDFIVGLVVLLGAAVIIGATLWVQQASAGRRGTRLEARFRDVGGVQVGNAVLIRGVRAGRITGIELTGGGWVQLHMALDESVELPPDPVVVLNVSSLFGEWQATVVSRSAAPENPDVQRQLAEASGARNVLPGATLPDIAQLTAVAGRIAGDVATVAERVQVAFDDSAARELRRSISNVEDVTSGLARTIDTQSGNLDKLAAEMRVGARSLNVAVQALQRTVARVDSSTSTGEIEQIVTDASVAAVQLRETTTELRETSRRLARSEGSLERTLARTDSIVTRVNAGEGSLGQLVSNPSLYRNGDSLIVELRALVADIKARPKRYLSVELF